MSRWALRLTTILAALALHVPAAAMAVRDCADPRVFERTPVNVLILPYTYGADPRRPLSPAARQLTLLIQQDSLLEMVKYRRIAIVNLISRPGSREECDPETIWERMMASGVAPGGGLVMMWGRLYEEGGDLFVQSYLRFGRAGRAESVALPVRPGAAPPGGLMPLRAALPATSVTLPPRKLSAGDLHAITAAFARAVRIHEQPSDSAKVVSVSPDLENLQPFGYYVTETRADGWMKVGSFYGGPSGWIRARVDGTEFPLRERMPELFFLDAVVGYLQYRVGTDESRFRLPDAPRAFIAEVQRSFGRYEERTAPDSAPAARALGRTLSGSLQLLDGGRAALSSAEADFVAAARLLPYSAEVRNLGNLSRFDACCNVAGFPQGTPPEVAATLLNEMMKAVSIDPENVNALRNLAAIHRLLDGWPGAVAAIGADEVARQRAALAGISSLK